jgi:hypothetical protein
MLQGQIYERYARKVVINSKRWGHCVRSGVTNYHETVANSLPTANNMSARRSKRVPLGRKYADKSYTSRMIERVEGQQRSVADATRPVGPLPTEQTTI